MCGIFGVVNYGSNTYLKAQAIRALTRSLLEKSQIRGHDASGLCVVSRDKIRIFKDKLPASELVKTHGYSDIVKNIHSNQPFRYVFGHARSETKGDHRFNVNNHPIIADKVVGVHNGMISNDDQLFVKHASDIQRAGKVDSEIIFRLIDMQMRVYGKNIVSSVQAAAEELRGSFACAFTTSRNSRYLTLFRNSASIAIYRIPISDILVFASTEEILKSSMQGHGSPLSLQFVEEKIDMDPGGLRIDTETGEMQKFDIKPQVARFSVGAMSSDYCPFNRADIMCNQDSCQDCRWTDMMPM